MSGLHHHVIERILEKLRLVRARRLSCFGSDKHQFQLNPPASEHQLARFEGEHHVVLPSDFRAFLKVAGNGGAGPYYGIDPLEQCCDIADWDDMVSSEVALTLPCPLSPEMSRESDWNEQFEEGVSPFQGVLAIGTQGCTYMMGLIVSGEYAGRVVYLDADYEPPYVVREPDFLSWYERWLDELLAENDMFWFGYGIGGNEASLLPMLADVTLSDEQRLEVVWALGRLKSLSPEGREQSVRMLQDPSPAVRAAGCHLLAKFENDEGLRHLPSLLQDESESVRQAAIYPAMRWRGDDWTEAVTKMLFAKNKEVSRTAFYQLQRANKLSQNLLRELLIVAPDHEVRASAAYACEWTQEDERLLISLLKDEDSVVRNHALHGVRKIRSEASLGAVIELLDRPLEHRIEYTTIEGILQMLGEVPGQQNREVLLRWTEAEDDFHRLKAIDSLCRLGDERVLPIAQQALLETRTPRSRTGASSIHSIGRLVQKSLLASPNQALRSIGEPPTKLAETGAWWRFWSRSPPASHRDRG